MNTFCPSCNSHTEHKVSIEKVKQRGGGKSKGARRQERNTKGYGNHGRYSRKAISQRNMTIKTSRKTDLRITCSQCGKKQARSRPRTRRVEIKRI